MSERRSLTKKEEEWRNNLCMIWSKKKKELNLNQQKLSDIIGWSSQGSVGQYLTGRIPLNTDAKIKFANALGVHVTKIDPELSNISGNPYKDKDELRVIFLEVTSTLSREEQLKMANEMFENALKMRE